MGGELGAESDSSLGSVAVIEELSWRAILAVMSSMGHPAVLHGERAVVEHANHEMADLLGYRDPDELAGLSVEQVVHISSMADRNRDAARLANDEVKTLRTQRTLIHHDGHLIYALVRKAHIVVDDAPMTVTLVIDSATSPNDVSGVKDRWQANHDDLTALLNRRGFESAVRTGEVSFPATVIAVDIDSFKETNDHYGHVVGDLVLEACARKLNAFAVEAGGIASRFGGDEFVLLVPSSTECELVNSMSVNSTTQIDGQRVSVTASVGAADAEGPNAVRHARDRADLQMYANRSSRHS